jgi:archaellum component FlaF (FlaF/FlaG flagellin family)
MLGMKSVLSLFQLKKRSLAAVLPLALCGLTSVAHADTVYTPVTVSDVETNLSIVGIGGGLNQWTTTLNVTNTGSTPIYDLSFLTFTALVSDDGGTSYYYGTWDNTLQQWTLSSPYAATVDVANASTYLSQADTTVTFPGGEGSDSFPLVTVDGVLLPGDSENIVIVDDISNNVNVYYFDGSFVATTPEPGTALLLGLGCLALGCVVFARRTVARKL